MEGASNTVTALTEFSKTVTSTISPSEVLSILGIGLGAGVSIFLLMWGARKILGAFVRALHGNLSV